MTSHQLAKIGKALFGNQWVGDMALIGKKSVKSVYRYSRGAKIPDEFKKHIYQEIDKRIETLKGLRK